MIIVKLATVKHRKTLIQELNKILEPDETHLLAILTNRPLISIHLDGETGEGFNTHVGICQGDCLSAVLFIFYLACALKNEPGEHLEEDLQAFLDIYYADDLTFSTTSEDHRKTIKEKYLKNSKTTIYMSMQAKQRKVKRQIDVLHHHHLLHHQKILAPKSCGPPWTGYYHPRWTLQTPPTKT